MPLIAHTENSDHLESAKSEASLWSLNCAKEGNIEGDLTGFKHQGGGNLRNIKTELSRI